MTYDYQKFFEAHQRGEQPDPTAPAGIRFASKFKFKSLRCFTMVSERYEMPSGRTARTPTAIEQPRIKNAKALALKIDPSNLAETERQLRAISLRDIKHDPELITLWRLARSGRLAQSA